MIIFFSHVVKSRSLFFKAFVVVDLKNKSANVTLEQNCSCQKRNNKLVLLLEDKARKRKKLL